MTVDLSTAKAGDIAYFRCGGSAEILTITNQYCAYITFAGDGFNNHERFKYNQLGFYIDHLFSPFDIIRIESKQPVSKLEVLRAKSDWQYLNELIDILIDERKGEGK